VEGTQKVFELAKEGTKVLKWQGVYPYLGQRKPRNLSISHKRLGRCVRIHVHILRLGDLKGQATLQTPKDARLMLEIDRPQPVMGKSENPGIIEYEQVVILPGL
jgi:hypothetical protein